MTYSRSNTTYCVIPRRIRRNAFDDADYTSQNEARKVYARNTAYNSRTGSGNRCRHKPYLKGKIQCKTSFHALA